LKVRKSNKTNKKAIAESSSSSDDDNNLKVNKSNKVNKKNPILPSPSRQRSTLKEKITTSSPSPLRQKGMRDKSTTSSNAVSSTALNGKKAPMSTRGRK
jgi:hypothetical protein